MRLSNRIITLVPGGDDGWDLYYRARDMQRSGTPVVMLTIGDHDIKTDPSILAAMQRSMAAGNLGYAPVNGSPELRAAIAARASRDGTVPVGASQVLVTPGGQAALFAALSAALDPGDSCIVLDPFYATYPQTVRAVDGVPIRVPTPADRGFQPDADAVAAALRPDTRAILINTPNNPTGVVYDRASLEALADLCHRHDLWMISDEVYACQVWQGAHLSPRDLPGMADRTLVVQSLSKSHAMTGSRLGWIVGPAPAVRALGDLSTGTTYGVPGFIQDAATFALTEAGAAEDAVRARYARRRDVALAALAGAGPGLRPVPPDGGMYVMLDVRGTGLSGIEVAAGLLDEERIAVMPGESFGTAAAGHLRVALTVPDAVLDDAIRRIVSFCARLTETAAA